MQETETGLREISQIRVLLNNLIVKEAALDSLNSYINKGDKDFMKLAPQVTFGDLLFAELIKRMKDFQSEKEELLRIYTPNHEKIISVNRKIEDVISYIKESIFDGKQVLEVVNSVHPLIPVIILTSSTKLKISLELVKGGAIDYITKNDNYFLNLPESITAILKLIKIRLSFIFCKFVQRPKF